MVRIAEVIEGSLGFRFFYYGAQASTSPQTNETPSMTDVQSCTAWNKIETYRVHSRVANSLR